MQSTAEINSIYMCVYVMLCQGVPGSRNLTELYQ